MKTFFFILCGLFLGAAPILNYYFTHGPSCPCHAIDPFKKKDA
ncbi:hypothetical protein M899_1017 [Bacteriovorax sp. BSW11_IV]|nr:hypothetical protein M899_1017 [Bacteriovorax sp. BSW11_IV]